MKWAERSAAGLLVLQPIAFFWHVLVNPRFHIPWDIEGFHYPLMAAMARALRAGEWPWWSPMIYSGYPMHADVQAQMFYPPAWLPILIRNWTGRDNLLYSLHWMVVLHLVLAGLLMFGMLRRSGSPAPAALFGGTVFQIGAFFASQTQHVGAVCGAAWLPLAWWAVLELSERFSWRWVAALSAALALSLLSGFLAVTISVYLSTGLLACGMVLMRSARPAMWGSFALGVLGSVLIAAVQLWPALELADRSFAKLRADWGAGLGGIPVEAWWGILWPNALGLFTPFDPTRYRLPYNFTFLWLYCGLAAIGLALLVVVRGDGRMRLFLLIAAFSLMMTAGDHIPGLRWMFERAPRSFRGAMYVEFFTAAFSAGLAAMGGLAAGRWLSGRASWAVALMTMIELHWAGSRRPMNTSAGSWRAGSSESRIDGSRPLVAAIEGHMMGKTPPPRLDILDLNFTFSMAAPLRPFPTAGGDSPFAPLEVLEVRRSYAGGNYWERAIPVAKPDSPWLDFLNVEYLIADKQKEDAALLGQSGWEKVKGGEWMRIYRNAEVRPRCYAAPRVRLVRDEAAARKAIREVDVREEVVVEAGPGMVTGNAEVEVVRYGHNAFELKVRAGQDAVVVCSETWYPGWRAFVEEREVPIYRANLAFRAVALPAGEHRVRFRFEPPRLWQGAWVSAASVLLLAALALRSPKR